MDQLNDYGTFIQKISKSPDEDEWLFSMGSRLEITQMFPAYFESSDV